MRPSLLFLILATAKCGSSAAPPAPPSGSDAAAPDGAVGDASSRADAADAPAREAALADAPGDRRSEDAAATDLSISLDGLAVADASAADAADGGDATGAVSDAAAPGDGQGDFQPIDPCLDAASYGGVATAPVISFTANEFAGYTPHCVKVARHTTVKWSAQGTTFGDHPLSPGTAGSPDNPIPPTASGLTRDATFDEAGFFPFHCQQHPVPMRGVIWVVE
jgi:plastocyanin